MPAAVVVKRSVVIGIGILLVLTLLIQGTVLIAFSGGLGERIRDAAMIEAKKSLGLDVRIGSLHAAPFNRLTADDIRIARDGRRLIEAGGVTVHYSLWRFVFGGFDPLAAIARIEIDHPTVNARLLADGTLDLADLLAGDGASPGGKLALRGIIAIRDGAIQLEGLPSNQAGKLTQLNGYIALTEYPVIRLVLRGNISKPAGGGIAVDGTIHSETGGLSGRVSLNNTDLADWMRTGLIPADVGRPTGRASVTVDARYEKGHLDLRKANLVWNKGTYWHSALPRPLEGIFMDVSFDKNRLMIRKAVARSGPSRISLAGGIRNLENPVLEGVRVRASEVRWSDWSGLFPVAGFELDGIVHASVIANGPWTKPLLTGSMEVSGGRVHYLPEDIQVTGIRTRLAVDENAVRIQRLRGDWDGGSLDVSGRASNWDRPHLSLDVKGRGLNLKRISALIPGAEGTGLSGRADIDAQISGLAENPIASARITLEQGRVMGQAVTGLELRASYRGALLDVALAAGIMKGRMTAWGTLQPFRPGTPLTGEIQLHELDVRQAMSLTSWDMPVSGRLSGSLVVRAESLDNPRIYGTAIVTEGGWSGRSLGPVDLAFNYVDSSLTVESLLARYQKGLIVASGSLEADGGLRFEGSGRQIDLGSFMDASGLPGTGVAEMSFKLDGTLQSPSGQAALTISSASVRGMYLGTLEAEMKLQGETLTLAQLKLLHPEHQVSATGTVNVKSGQIDARVDTSGLSLGAVAVAAGIQSPVAVGGRAGGAFTLSGTLSHPQAHGELQMQEITVGPESIDKARANLGWDERGFEITGLEIQKGEMVARIEGRLDPKGPISGTLRVDGLDLAGIESLKGATSGASGIVSLDGRFGGSISVPRFNGTVSGRGLAVSGVQIGNVSGGIAWADDRLNLDNLDLNHEGTRYVLLGWLAPSEGQVDMRLKCDNAQISELVRLFGLKGFGEIDGIITGFAHIRGPLASPEGRLMAEIENGRIAGKTLDGSVDARFAMEGDKNPGLAWIELNRLRLWQGEGFFMATGQYEASRGTDIFVTARQFDIEPLMTLVGGRDVLSGIANAELRLTGYPSNTELTGDATLSNGKLIGIDFSRFSASAQADARAIRLKEVRIERRGDVVLAEGTIPIYDAGRRALGLPLQPGKPDLPLDINIQSGSLALDWLPILIDPSLKVTAGRAAIQGHVGGSLHRLDMKGDFRIRGGAMEVPGMVMPFTMVEGSGRFEGERIILDEIRGDYGVGRMTADGSITIFPFGIRRFDLKVKADRLAYASPMFTGTLRGAVSYSGPIEAPVIGGEVWVSAAKMAYVPGPPGPALPPIGLDLKVHTEGDVRLKQEMTVLDMDVPIEGNLAIRGTLAQPKLSGEISAHRGTVVAYRNGFQVVEANAEFAESRGAIPFIRVLARKPVKGGQIFLRAEGIAGPDLRLQLDSSPPMSSEEIFAALDIPEVLRDKGLTVQNILDEGVYVVGKAMFDTVGRNVAEWLNVDDFSLVPQGGSLFSGGLELRVGKFITPQLYLGYSSLFKDTLTHTLAADYYISPWSVIYLSYSTNGDYSLGYSLQLRF